MNLRDRLVALDRLQNGRTFKIVATALVIALVLGLLLAYWLARGDIQTVDPGRLMIDQAALTSPEGKVDEEGLAKARDYVERVNETLERIVAGQTDWTSVAVGAAAVAGVCIGAIWLGLGLTGLALLLAAGLVIGPMQAFDSTRDWGRMFFGVVALSGAFVTLMRLMSLALAGSGPVFAVARNALAEAVRLKLSLAFIVILVFMLAAIPGFLNEESPLRYRVQSFLSFGTGLSFWVIAVLVVLFSVSTVATEQRDKVIWQTMTKPVSSWQYVLGKWLGVSSLAAVLLAVSGTGVFLFTEYLRSRPAEGEVRAYEPRTGAGITQDRLVLETQVLTARVAIENERPQLDPALFAESVENYLRQQRAANTSFAVTPEARADVEQSLRTSFENGYRELQPNQSKVYTFRGLERAREMNAPLTLRWRIDAGTNQPDIVYRMSMKVSNMEPMVREAALAQYLTMPLPPTAINSDGTLTLDILNGDFITGRPNPEAIKFPAGGLELSYSYGSWRHNFVRVQFVMWVKLCFLSIMSIFAATFLSFAVASLVSFATFFAAEGAGLIEKSLEVFDAYDRTKVKGDLVIWKWVVVQIAEGVSTMFAVYADLKPTAKLVDGMLMSWSSVAMGTAVLATASALLFALASVVFARRELAMYSGN